MIRLVVVAVLAGCAAPARPHAQPVHGAPPRPADPGGVAPGPIVHGPHGGAIQRLAVTERGDAVLSADDLGELRLWPVLDGSVEPVVVTASAPPVQLALEHDGDGLAAALLDQAGGLEIVRLTAGGGSLGRVQIAGLGYLQVIAIEGGFLARGADDTIARFDARGGAHGRLALGHGEHVVTLATRHGASLATVELATTGTTAVRWIETAAELRFGATVPLGWRVSTVALSPDHHHLAAIGEHFKHLVFDLTTPTATAAVLPQLGIVPTSVGFIDDRYLTLANDDPSSVSEWFDLESGQVDRRDDGVATNAPMVVGDRVAVAGVSAFLELATYGRNQALGYRDFATDARLDSRGDHAELMLDRRRVWLDEHLDETRLVDDHELDLPYTLDATHTALLTQRQGNRVGVAIVDSAHAVRFDVCLSKERAWLTYDYVGHILGVQGTDQVQRFQLDLAANTVTRLRPLAVAGLPQVLLLPANADGVVAVQLRADRLDMFRDDGTPGRAPLAAGYTDVPSHSAALVGVDRDGAIYTIGGGRLGTHHYGKPPVYVTVDHEAESGAISGDGTAIVLVGGNQVTVVDRVGVERWSHAVWDARSAVFVDGDRSVTVLTGGGLVSLDASTGQRLAARCGWGFGLTAGSQRRSPEYGQTPQCAVPDP